MKVKNLLYSQVLENRGQVQTQGARWEESPGRQFNKQERTRERQRNNKHQQESEMGKQGGELVSVNSLLTLVYLVSWSSQAVCGDAEASGK